ncbi:MAG: 50S ribosomal protein L9 [Clostridia bacterium]
MKVLLQADIKGSGKAGDIITVSDGYARNFLLPKGLAVPADAQSINATNIRKSAEQHKKDMAKIHAKELASGMHGLTVKIYAKAGTGGRLFGSVTVQEIVDALKAQYDIAVDKKKIKIKDTIKTTGKVEVSAHMFEDADATFIVEVLPISEN